MFPIQATASLPPGCFSQLLCTAPLTMLLMPAPLSLLPQVKVLVSSLSQFSCLAITCFLLGLQLLHTALSHLSPPHTHLRPFPCPASQSSPHPAASTHVPSTSLCHSWLSGEPVHPNHVIVTQSSSLDLQLSPPSFPASTEGRRGEKQGRKG